MADWNLPTLSSLYSDVMTILKGRDTDAITLCLNNPTNPSAGMMKWERALDKFQEYSGAAWVDQVISIAGGGTGAGDISTARANLGIGTLGAQNSNNVTITGGTISVASVTASGAINGGSLAATGAVTGASAAITGNVSAGSLSGQGTGLTVIPAGELTGTVADARLTSNIPKKDTANIFSNSNEFQTNVKHSHASQTTVDFYVSGAGADSKFFRIITTATDWVVQKVNDAYNTATNLFSVDRSGNITIAGTIKERGRTTALGEWVTVSFNAANFTAGAGSWTVEAGDILSFKYRIVGKCMTVSFWIQNSVTSNNTTEIRIAIPGSVTVVGNYCTPCFIMTGDGYAVTGEVLAQAGYSYLVLRWPYNLSYGNITPGGSVQARGQIEFEIA